MSGLAPIKVEHIRALVACVIAIQALAFLSIAPPWVFVCLVLFGCVLFFPKLGESKLVRFGLIIGSVASFAITYGKSFSVEMAGIFLLMVASMKAIELRTRRDALVFVYAMFYLSAISMLFEQGIPHVLLELISVLVCFSILMRLNASSLGSVRGHIWRVSKLLTLAVPFAVCLFLFFPRFAPLWSLPIKTSTAQTGMSETVSPGSIADLSQSAERAFRVSFRGDVPPRNDLYWRALVLDQFDGLTWSRAAGPLTMERSRQGLLSNRRYDQYQPQDGDLDYYDVILEPHNNRWAFALADSNPISGNVYQLGTGAYEFRQDVVSPTPYRMAFGRASQALAEIPGARVVAGVARKVVSPLQDLQLPPGGNPRARQLVDTLLLAGPTESQLVSAILRFFREQNFAYTLRPPSLSGDTIDQFLFETRRGFCEHYASSMAFLLREAGIPARVVAGYQGGEYNANLDYLVVRQYDAHAWVEAKITGLGWVRIDPTAYIAPDRIERNLEEAMREEGSFLEDNPYASFSRSVAALNWLATKADEVNYQWQRLVLGYGEQDQRAMFKRVFGRFDMRTLLWVLVSSLFVVAIVVVLYIWLGRYRRSLSGVERRYLRYILILKLYKVERRLGETPLQFLHRVQPNLNALMYRGLEKRTRELLKKLYNVENEQQAV